jgi:hypothetical protein
MDSQNSAQVTPAGGRSLNEMFLRDGAAMAGIVALVAQPFAQNSLKELLQIPDWLPLVVAIGVSALLALYKMKFVVKASFSECCLIVPMVALVVFSLYATGNNVAYYTQLGLDKPVHAVDHADAHELTVENELLKQQLNNANEAIEALRRAVEPAGNSDGKHSEQNAESKIVAGLGRLLNSLIAPATAQEVSPDPKPSVPSNELGKILRKYEEQKALIEKDLKRNQAQPGNAEQPRLQRQLLKSL